MLALSIVLLALVVLLVVVSFVGTSEEVVYEFANVTITTSSGAVFVAGVAAGLVALASLVALRISLRGSWKRRKELRELRRQAGAKAEPEHVGQTTAEPRRTEGTEPAEESAPAQPTQEQRPDENGVGRDDTQRPPDEGRS